MHVMTQQLLCSPTCLMTVLYDVIRYAIIMNCNLISPEHAEEM